MRLIKLPGRTDQVPNRELRGTCPCALHIAHNPAQHHSSTQHTCAALPPPLGTRPGCCRAHGLAQPGAAPPGHDQAAPGINAVCWLMWACADTRHTVGQVDVAKTNSPVWHSHPSCVVCVNDTDTTPPCMWTSVSATNTLQALTRTLLSGTVLSTPSPSRCCSCLRADSTRNCCMRCCRNCSNSQSSPASPGCCCCCCNGSPCSCCC